MNLPNKLSMLRILMIPVFVILALMNAPAAQYAAVGVFGAVSAIGGDYRRAGRAYCAQKRAGYEFRKIHRSDRGQAAGDERADRSG